MNELSILLNLVFEMNISKFEHFENVSYKIEKNLYYKFIEHIEKNVQFEIVREKIKFHDIKSSNQNEQNIIKNRTK